MILLININYILIKINLKIINMNVENKKIWENIC